MIIAIFILFLVLGICAFSGYFIGIKLYRNLVKNENKNARVLSIITGIFSFLFILAGIVYLFLVNLDFHR